MSIKYISTLKKAVYKESCVPEILRTFLKELTELSQKENLLAFYLDPLSIKIEEYLKLIDETDQDINPVISDMGEHAQKLKTKFRKNGINHFDMKMRRKALISLFTKINKVLRAGKSVDSINDLLGLEFTIHTKSEYDSAESLDLLYKMANLTLEYFSSSNEHVGTRFSICDTSSLKDTISAEHTLQELEELKKLNPHIFVPEKSKINKRFANLVKDYVFQPKQETAYQGVQFVVKSESGFCFEIQIKTQPMRDFLDMDDSPGNHSKHKKKQATIFSQANEDDIETPQFDLDFDSTKMQHIYGYRKSIKYDRSGIVQAVKWDLKKSTHPNPMS